MHSALIEYILDIANFLTHLELHAFYISSATIHSTLNASLIQSDSTTIEQSIDRKHQTKSTTTLKVHVDLAERKNANSLLSRVSGSCFATAVTSVNLQFCKDLRDYALMVLKHFPKLIELNLNSK